MLGIGGTFEKAALNAKKAVLDDIGNFHVDYKDIELNIINKLNDTNIGPMGTGGKTTCLDVSIITAPSHIASLAVAVNIQCHVARHKVVIL